MPKIDCKEPQETPALIAQPQCQLTVGHPSQKTLQKNSFSEKMIKGIAVNSCNIKTVLEVE